MQKDPRRREEGTTSLADTYKKNTPGQKKLKTFLEYAYFGTMGSLDLSTVPGPSGAFGGKETKAKSKKKNKYNQHMETKPTMPTVGY